MARSPFWMAFALVAASCAPRPAAAPAGHILYIVRVARPADRLFEVTMRLRASREELVVHLPATTPGDIGFKQHARYLDHFQASRENGTRLDYERTGAQTWRIRVPDDSTVIIHYRIHMNERDVLRLGTNSLDEHGGFLEGSSVFLYADGHVNDSVEVRYELPESWTVVTTLPSSGTRTFAAEGYRALVDAPVQFGGEMQERTLADDSMLVRLVFDRPLPPYDRALFDRNVRAIVRTASAYFGERPFSDYTILVHWRPDLDFGGGLEHGRAMVLNIGSQWMLDLPVNAAGTIAHEIFHAWNAEAFHPRELHEWDFAGPNYSPHLWFVEGVTSYFATRILIGSGILPEDRFFAMMSRSISSYENDPGRGWQSLAESGVATWIFPADALDYYRGGEVVGFLLDLTLRLDSGGERGLEHVLRALYEESRRPGYRGYDGAQLRAAVREVAGHDAEAFFDRYVIGRGPIEYASLLHRAGLSVSTDTLPVGQVRYTIAPLGQQTPLQAAVWRQILRGGTP